MLLLTAYDTGTYQQIIGPSWLADDRFDIAAKMPDAAPKDQIPQMLQSLMRERFNLQAHWETRSMPAYTLGIGKSGAKLVTARPDAPPPLLITQGSNGPNGYKGALTIDGRARLLSIPLGRPVVDKTGLMGKYDIDVSFASDLAAGSVATDADPQRPGSIFSIFPEKLGLRLEAEKAPLKVLVVDHVERAPTGN
jgi:uncharacterized protein (TIGR03435 family)